MTFQLILEDTTWLHKQGGELLPEQQPTFKIRENNRWVSMVHKKWCCQMCLLYRGHGSNDDWWGCDGDGNGWALKSLANHIGLIY